jgi:hypothetical protein
MGPESINSHQVEWISRFSVRMRFGLLSSRRIIVERNPCLALHNLLVSEKRCALHARDAAEDVWHAYTE